MLAELIGHAMDCDVGQRIVVHHDAFDLETQGVLSASSEIEQAARPKEENWRISELCDIVSAMVGLNEM